MIDVLAGKLEQVKSSVTSFLWCGEKKKLSSMYIMCHCPDESKFLGWNVCSKARLVSPAVGYSKHLFYPYPFLLFVPISRLFRQLHFHSAPKNVRWHTFSESRKRINHYCCSISKSVLQDVFRFYPALKTVFMTAMKTSGTHLEDICDLMSSLDNK